MKETSKKLLIDAYLAYTSGAYDTVNTIIKYGEELYCGLSNKDISAHQEIIREIQLLVWNIPPCACNSEEWRKRQEMYERLLNEMI